MVGSPQNPVYVQLRCAEVGGLSVIFAAYLELLRRSVPVMDRSPVCFLRVRTLAVIEREVIYLQDITTGRLLESDQHWGRFHTIYEGPN